MDWDYWDRNRLDPRQEFPADEMRRVERLALRVLMNIPHAEVSRTRDVIQFDADLEGEDGLVVLVTAEAIELRLPSVEWTTVYCPVRVSHLWKRLEGEELDQVAGYISQARRARRAQFRPCQYCGRSTPPEHRYNENTCHGCASAHLGILY